MSETRDVTPPKPSIFEQYRKPLFLAGGVGLVVLMAIMNLVNSASSNPTVRAASTSGKQPMNRQQADRLTAEVQNKRAALQRQMDDAFNRETMLRNEMSGFAASQGLPGGQYGAPPIPVQQLALPQENHETNVVLSFRQSGSLASLKQETDKIATEQKALLTQSLDGPRFSAPVATPPPAPTAIQGPTLTDDRTHTLFEGSILEGVLVNRLNGTYTGPVIVMVTSPVYSLDRQTVLIPDGSRVLGEAQRVGSLGQQRLAITFHRIIMPNGRSASLDKFQGLNAVGETGLKDQVQNHWGHVFGASIAMGMLSGFSGFGTGSALTANGVDQYRQSVANRVGQESEQVFQQRLTNILPTVVIEEGHRVKVYIAEDLHIPAYDETSIQERN